MKIVRVLSYNLWFNKAFHELPTIIKKHKVDVLCLQECRINDIPQEVGGLQLVRADPMYSGLGLAMYIRASSWQVVKHACFALPFMVYEKMMRSTGQQRLQLLELAPAIGKAPHFVVGNTHISNLMAGNRGRRKQATEAAMLIQEFAKSKPLILTGDFNYPFFEQKLLRVMEKAGLHYVAGTQPTFYRWPKRIFDRMFIANVSVNSFEVLPFGASDHAAIFGDFTLN